MGVRDIRQDAGKGQGRPAAGWAVAGRRIPARLARPRARKRRPLGPWRLARSAATPRRRPGEQCALIQSVVAEDRSNAGLTVIVLKTADQKSKLMRVVAPLACWLPSGSA